MGKARGFTLIEIAVVVAIIGLLALIALPLADLAVKRTKEHELRLALREIRTALDAYKTAVEEGRIPRRTGAGPYPRRLEELADGVTDAKNPNRRQIYFLRRLPRDPMYRDTAVPPADTWGKRSYASPPDAPSEGEDIFDVYSRSGATGLNGIPYREW